jgi:hypothetical protein
MVGPNGLEPSTSSVSGKRSNQLSYGPIAYGVTSPTQTIRPQNSLARPTALRCQSRNIKYSQQLPRLLGTAKYLIIPSSRTHLGLAIGLKNDTARSAQQGRRNQPTGSPHVGRQLQDTETGHGWKVAIIRKKSLAAGCQCRNNLQRIRRLDSRCGS